MINVFFLHQIKHNKTTGVWDKGIVVKDTEGADNLAAAKQAYHAYLGAYAYGHDPNTDYVQCKITNLTGTVVPKHDEIWMDFEDVDPNTQEEIEG